MMAFLDQPSPWPLCAGVRALPREGETPRRADGGSAPPFMNDQHVAPEHGAVSNCATTVQLASDSVGKWCALGVPVRSNTHHGGGDPMSNEASPQTDEAWVGLRWGAAPVERREAMLPV